MKSIAMKNRLAAACFLLVFATFGLQAQSVTVNIPMGADICALSSLDLSKMTCFDDAGKTKARANLSTLGQPIVIRDTLYTSGVGTHAPSKAVIKVNGATRFVASLGIDDEADQKADHGVVDYVVSLFTPDNHDGTTVKSGRITRDDASTVKFDLDIAGADYLVLDLQNAGVAWADHADWAGAYFVCEGEFPAMVTENEMYADESKIVELPANGSEGAEIIPLSSLDLAKATCGWGTIKADRSIDGNAITLNDTIYRSGVGTHATSQIIVKLNGAVTRFVTRVGIDDEVKSAAGTNAANANVDYRVSLKAENGDLLVVAEGNIRATDTATPLIDVDCNGWKYLILDADKGAGDAYDHVDWANAYFEYHEQNSTRPEIVSAEELSSKLACATRLFSQPGVRFMHRLRAANPGAAISVSDLPDGLTYNERRQLVEGRIDAEGDYTYTVTVTNDGEESSEQVLLTVSSTLQQPVPFMGWLSWNVVQGDISENVIRTVADAMESKGLVKAGYRYLVIDDLWHADQRESGTDNPLPDPAKFPNGVKAAADYVHGKGMKFGIYSDGGTRTCAGRFGSYGYETIDAKAYASWGVDLLKYDYCNAPSDLNTCQARYKAMGDALKASGRDILFYMCEWGVREPWKWGTETGATTWRATYDTRDCWQGKSGGIGILESIAGMKDLWAYSGPNRFNDADMMCVGIHGTGKSSSDLCGTGPGMTQTEYRTQFSLWSMWASPLTLSFDLRKDISDDDLELMTNEEVIAINQDPMGLQAEYIGQTGNIQTYMKDLENGDVAVALVNLGDASATATVDFSKLSALEAGVAYQVRDLWKKSNLGEKSASFSVMLTSHETKLYRFSRATVDGISAPATDLQPSVSVDSNAVTVHMNGTAAGRTKRVIVSDLRGCVQASATTSADSVTLTLPSAPGVYFVSVTAAGVARTLKFVR
ncbi:MAG: NPCBM/NEW2 domain-containing protein [Prevotellaceae bacterium]|nr:NPCBM/NEW2 domain-containing protein [Prevotellaceae bacterium]